MTSQTESLASFRMNRCGPRSTTQNATPESTIARQTAGEISRAKFKKPPAMITRPRPVATASPSSSGRNLINRDGRPVSCKRGDQDKAPDECTTIGCYTHLIPRSA